MLNVQEDWRNQCVVRCTLTLSANSLIAMAHFDEDGFSPALQVTINFFRSRFSCSFQAKSVLDAFEELNEPEDTKKVLLGYITRAKAAERTFSSQGRYSRPR